MEVFVADCSFPPHALSPALSDAFCFGSVSTKVPTGRCALSGQDSKSITRNRSPAFELTTSDTFVFCAANTTGLAPSKSTALSSFEGKSMRESAREPQQIRQRDGTMSPAISGAAADLRTRSDECPQKGPVVGCREEHEEGGGKNASSLERSEQKISPRGA